MPQTINLTPNHAVIFQRFLNDAISQIDAARRQSKFIESKLAALQSLDGYDGTELHRDQHFATELRRVLVSLEIALESITNTDELETLRTRLSAQVGELAAQVDITNIAVDELKP